MKLFILIILTFSFSSFSYIIKPKTILDNLTKNNGKGINSVELEIEFIIDGNPVYFNETWIAEDGDNLSLSVKGPQFEYYAVYKNKVKYVLEDNKLKSTRYSSEFFERYFHIRSSLEFMNSLVNDKIVPADFKKNVSQGKSKLLSLNRMGGVISYFFGSPTPSEAPSMNPGIWIEQDRFTIRQIRYPSQSRISALDFQTYNNQIQFPKLREVAWGDKTVQIRSNLIKTDLSADFKKKLQSTWLTSEMKNSSTNANPIYLEFYQRFR